MAHRHRAFGIGPPRPRFPWLASDRMPTPCTAIDRAADSDPNTAQPFPSLADLLVSRFRARLYEDVLFNVSGPQDVPDEMRRLREFSAMAPVPPRPWVESPRTRPRRRRTWR
jgi:hypothetical protein